LRAICSTGLKPQSSQSQPPKWLGLQSWARGAQLIFIIDWFIIYFLEEKQNCIRFHLGKKVTANFFFLKTTECIKCYLQLHVVGPEGFSHMFICWLLLYIKLSMIKCIALGLEAWAPFVRILGLVKVFQTVFSPSKQSTTFVFAMSHANWGSETRINFPKSPL
jgi:hypothetical protein